MTASTIGGATPRHYGFGSTAAIVTSLGLIVGFGETGVSRATIVNALLVIAIADNISDSLSMHVYQESERLEARAAVRAMATNFIARLIVTLTFVAIVLLLPLSSVPAVVFGWGVALLCVLSYALARHTAARPWREMLKYVGVALAVVAVSRVLGRWISSHVQG